MIALSSVLAVLGANRYLSRTSEVQSSLQMIGLSAMTESQLRDTVDSHHLLVYWAGPSPGSKYLLNTSGANVIVLTVLPPGQAGRSTRTSYPEVATYVVKDAFQAVLTGGANPDVAGFINADGNSVFYTRMDPKNAYVGIRGEDIEVQVFHPVQGMSLEIATVPGHLVPISKAAS